MSILILGGGGMLGHQLYRRLSLEMPKVFATVRKDLAAYSSYIEAGVMSSPERLIPNLDLMDTARLMNTLNEVDPDMIINCAGVTTRKISVQDAASVIEINSTLPHRLKAWCERYKKALIHISTDCVFSGKTGPYTETSYPDAPDFYGKTKSLGEVEGSKILTLRTSIIGHEIEGKTELLEWFLSQKGKKINGFKNVMYSGVTTPFLSDVISQLIARGKTAKGHLDGLFQVASTPISKLDLLKLANEVYANGCDIKALEEPRSDKTLIGKKFTETTGIKTPSWQQMLEEMKNQKVSNAKRRAA